MADFPPPADIISYSATASGTVIARFRGGREEAVSVNCCAWCRSILTERPDLLKAARVSVHILEQLEAETKARRLLVSLLNEEQQKEFQQYNHFHVASQTGRLYRIRFGTVSNVDRITELGSYPYKTYCAHLPNPSVPVYDHMAAQLLALKYNEAHFLSVAL